MIQSIIVYGSVLFILMKLGRVAAYREKVCMDSTQSFLNWEILLSLLVYSLICGIRYDVGVDHLSYLQSYEYVKEGYNPRNETEFLFSLFTDLFSKNYIHYSVYFSILAFIQLSLIYYAFKSERYLFPFIIFVFFTSGWFFNFMGGIRQTIVCSIFIYAAKFIKERKLFNYFICIFIGFFIHKSAIFLFPLYFLSLNKDWFKNRWIQIGLIVLSAVISNLNIWENFIDLISWLMTLVGYDDRYIHLDAQLKNSTEEFTRGIRFYAPLLIYILIAFFSPILKNVYKNTKINIYYNLYFIGALSFPLFFNNFLLKRPMFYFTSLSIITSAYFIHFLWKNLKNNFMNTIIFVTVILLHLGILIAYIASDFHTNYKFFWEIKFTDL